MYRQTRFTSSSTGRSVPSAGRNCRRISISATTAARSPRTCRKSAMPRHSISLSPPDHVWLQIAGRLHQEGRVSRRGRCARFRHLGLLAHRGDAGAGDRRLALLAAAASTRPRRRRARGRSGAQPRYRGRGNAAAADAVQSITDDLMTAEQHYQSAIAKLGGGDQERRRIDRSADGGGASRRTCR